MAFTKATAPIGLQTGRLLSADNSIPERHIVVETLRNAAPRLGLSASVITTLDAMLSCLAPKRSHHTVFASNSTLTFRRNGISDRTIRRHAATLQEVGLLVRHDSPNRKRFTKYNKQEGKALRFGFDLSPLFERLAEIASMAAEVMREKEKIDYLRTKIRAAASAELLKDPGDAKARDVCRLLRRKLSLQDCEDLLLSLPISDVREVSTDTDQTNLTASMTGSDGQNVRHHHKSSKEPNDKEHNEDLAEPSSRHAPTSITVAKLVLACPEAATLSPKDVITIDDVVSHGRTLAPMMGIAHQYYEAASRRLGSLRAAATVWAMVQFHNKINSSGAYFRSITTGARSKEFDLERLIQRLAKARSYAS